MFGLEEAPPAEEGFLATWVWYENIRQKLKQMSSSLNKRGIGNFYSMMKNNKYL